MIKQPQGRSFLRLFLPGMLLVSAAQGASTPALDSEQSAFLSLINNYRAQNGAGALQVSIALQNSSQWMAADMAARNYFSHADSAGRDPFTRMAEFGYPYAPAGENIAAGYSTAQDTFTQWQTACDPDAKGVCTYAHRQNMLDPDYRVIGIGRAYSSSSTYKWYWATDFGGVVDPLITSTPPASRPAISSVFSGSDFGAFTSVAPGSWIEIYGSNLATNSRSWAWADFNGINAPTSLDGLWVTIGNRRAFVDYISPTQVNAQIPSDVGTGPQPVIVGTPTDSSSSYIVTVNDEQPGLLAPISFAISGTQYVAALFSDGTTYVLPPNSISGLTSRRAHAGDVITLYGIGFGAVTPSIPAGQVAQQGNNTSAAFHLLFGQTEAAVLYAGLAPGEVGLYQFNVVVPNVPSSDAIPLTFSVGGVSGRQTLFIAVH